MKRKILLLSLLSCLYLLSAGCGKTEKGHSSDSGADAASSSVSSADTDAPDTSDASPVKTKVTPVTRYGITLSDVVVTDAYGSLSIDLPEGEADIAAETYYPIGMLGLWRSTEDYEGWGYQTFWSYLVPTDATVTFHITDEIKSYWLDSYSLEATEEGSGDSWNATYVDTYESDELDPGDYTLTRDEILKLIPGADLILCGMGDNYIEILFDDGSVITIPEADPNADPDAGLSQAAAHNLTLGTEAIYTGGDSKTESVKIALGNDKNGNRNYGSAEIHHIPADATITIQILEDKNYCSINGYMVEKTADGRWNTTPCGYFYRSELQAGGYTLTLADIQTDIPEFDLLRISRKINYAY